MYLVERGDRLYEGYSVVYYTKSGKKSVKGMVGKALGSKKALLAKDPDAIIKLKAKLKAMSAPHRATEKTKEMLATPATPALPYAGDPVLRYANYVLRPIWTDILKLKALLNYQRSKTNIEFNVEALIWQTVINRIVSPCSHRRHFLRQADWLGDTLTCSSLKHLYRMLSFVANKRKPILRGINKSLKLSMPRDLSVVFYDVTNTWYETAWDDEEKLDMAVSEAVDILDANINATQREEIKKSLEKQATSTLRMRGPSKEHRRDPIVSIALVVDRDGIPVDYRVYKGNSSEKVTMSESITALASDYGIKNAVVVADNGLNTAANILKLSSEKQGFLLAHSLGKAKQTELEEILSPEGWQTNKDGTCRVKELKSSAVDDEGEVVDYRLVIGWSQKRYEEEMFRIEAKEAAAKAAVATGKDLSTVKFGWKKYVKVEKQRAKELNNKQLEKDKRIAGYFAYRFKDSRDYDPSWLALSKEKRNELSAWEIIEQYHRLYKIEECFRIMKTNFNLRPLYVYTDEHIEGQVLICIMALIVLRVLAKKLKEAGTPMTTDQMIRALDSARLAVTIEEGREALFRPLAQPEQAQEDSSGLRTIHLHRETDLSKIMKTLGLSSLPPISDKDELARCLHTRFDSDSAAIGCRYVV